MSKIVEYKKFQCQYCGKEFEKTLRYVKSETNKGKKIKYCSRECSCNGRKKKIKVNCDVCRIDFEKLPDRIGNINCCSKKCLDKYNLSNKTKYKCLNCNKEFYVENSYIKTQQKRNQEIKFCCRKCKHDYIRKDMIEVECTYCKEKKLKSKNNIGKLNFCNKECKDNYHKLFNNKTIVCKYCGENFTVNNYKADIQNRQFCNWKCKTSYFGIIYDNYKNIARYLRTSNEYDKWRNKIIAINKCIECGSSENLQAHHVNTLFNISKKYNFDKERIKASKEFNDITNGLCLCQSCHNKKHIFMKQKQYISKCRSIPKLQKE